MVRTVQYGEHFDPIKSLNFSISWKDNCNHSSWIGYLNISATPWIGFWGKFEFCNTIKVKMKIWLFWIIFLIFHLARFSFWCDLEKNQIVWFEVFDQLISRWNLKLMNVFILEKKTWDYLIRNMTWNNEVKYDKIFRDVTLSEILWGERLLYHMQENNIVNCYISGIRSIVTWYKLNALSA